MRLLLRSSAFVIASIFAVGQSSQPVRIETATLPPPVVTAYYSFQLRATGGVPPYKWSVAEGSLSPGLRLDADSGLIVGTPERSGAFQFTVRVTDSATPPHTTTRKLGTEMLPPLTVVWGRPPTVTNGGIFGSVVVANNRPRRTDLTLIIVAVNEFGKAFVLGYQHPMLQPKEVTPEIPFGVALPRGDYVVHVDAVGEDPDTEALYRARLQTYSPMQVT